MNIFQAMRLRYVLFVSKDGQPYKPILHFIKHTSTSIIQTPPNSSPSHSFSGDIMNHVLLYTRVSSPPKINKHTFLRTLPRPLLKQTTPPALSRPRRPLIRQLMSLCRGVRLRIRKRRLMLCKRGRGIRGCTDGCRGRRGLLLLLFGRGGGLGGRC